MTLLAAELSDSVAEVMFIELPALWIPPPCTVRSPARPSPSSVRAVRMPLRIAAGNPIKVAVRDEARSRVVRDAAGVDGKGAFVVDAASRDVHRTRDAVAVVRACLRAGVVSIVLSVAVAVGDAARYRVARHVALVEIGSAVGVVGDGSTRDQDVADHAVAVVVAGAAFQCRSPLLCPLLLPLTTVLAAKLPLSPVPVALNICRRYRCPPPATVMLPTDAVAVVSRHRWSPVSPSPLKSPLSLPLVTLLLAEFPVTEPPMSVVVPAL